MIFSFILFHLRKANNINAFIRRNKLYNKKYDDDKSYI